MKARAAARGLPVDQIEAEAFSHTAIREYVTAEQIADQVLYLASPRGRTIPGQSLSVCGGTERPG
ncbi:SDR family oxidoreductase [Paracoccus sphaerophysae]|uniref:SDR family oxidoreductase n=1 Tax=Paracoccus sphaerophysae TaxID=690417 RepID=UPI002355BB04|nr:SDR family oxidoreductase [Paracoccus sphaerophysae]